MALPQQLSFEFATSRLIAVYPASWPIDTQFPEEQANQLAALEVFNKHLHRPNTYLHKWWARRSGTTFRHILKGLVADAEAQDFYAPGGLEGKVVLDPMMGGGTTLHEAIRMGASVVGIDIDPIPVLQAAATLTANALPHQTAVFRDFIGRLNEILSPLYRTTCPHCGGESEIQFALRGLRRRCSCGEVLFVDSFVLRQNGDNRICICPECLLVYTGLHNNCARNGEVRLLEKGTRRCPDCGSEYADLKDIPFPQRYLPIAIVGKCPQHGAFFKTPDAADLQAMDAPSSKQQLEARAQGGFAVPRGPKSDDLLHRGIHSYLDLFAPRQLFYLRTVLDLMQSLAESDRLWLALLISTSLEFTSLLAGYKGGDASRPGAIRHVFSHHAYSFPYTSLENNPIFSGNTSGTLNRLFQDRIIKAGQWAANPTETKITPYGAVKVAVSGEIDKGTGVLAWEDLKRTRRAFMTIQADAAAAHVPEGVVDFVVTDPPYYDSVQYSDLSYFFRAWLRLLLPHDVDWAYNPLTSAVSEGTSVGNRKYGEVLGRIWQNCRRALNKETGRLIFTFHHWNPEAWAELTLSLKMADFELVNRYVVFSENPISVHIRQLRALKHDTVLVLRPGQGESSVSAWSRPARIDSSDSYAFGQDCGAALGWFLTADLSEDQIRAEWKELLGGNGNGKAS